MRYHVFVCRYPIAHKYMTSHCADLIPITHKYMTSHCPDLVQIPLTHKYMTSHCPDYVFVCYGVSVLSQDSELSCICVLGVSSQDNEISCICLLGVSSDTPNTQINDISLS
jgi:hypothetical protein